MLSHPPVPQFHHRLQVSHQRELPLLHSSYWLMGRTKTLPGSSLLTITQGLCRLSSVPAGRWSFPTLSPQSLYGCLDPYPATSPRCAYPFLPGEHRPHLTDHKFGTLDDPHNAASVRKGFRGCSHSFTFRLLYSLGPQAAPTAETLSFQGGRAVYTTQWTCGYRTNCGITTCLNRVIDTAGLSPAGLRPCRPLPVCTLSGYGKF